VKACVTPRLQLVTYGYLRFGSTANKSQTPKDPVGGPHVGVAAGIAPFTVLSQCIELPGRKMFPVTLVPPKVPFGPQPRDPTVQAKPVGLAAKLVDLSCPPAIPGLPRNAAACKLE
jgi:hypothetical protein